MRVRIFMRFELEDKFVPAGVACRVWTQVPPHLPPE